MVELMAVNRQWASRPAEERYLDLPSMLAYARQVKQTSQSKVLKLKDLSARPCEADKHNALEIVGPSGNPAGITNWAFTQLCQRIEAPTGYLASLPANLAAQNIQHGLNTVADQEIGLLVTRYEHDEKGNVPLSIRAITGDTYTRIWNADMLETLIDYVGDGRTGTFKIPGEFGVQVPITKENTTLYLSDKDVFVCLVDEENRLELPNRRDGKTGTLARGFIMWNSEVGSQTFGVTTFLFDYMCSNRIIWGAQNVTTFKRRHTKNVLESWHDGYKQIEAYRQAKASDDQAKLIEAANYRIVDLGKTITNESEAEKAKRRSEEASKFLSTKLALPVVTNKLVDGIKASFIKAEGRPIETLWDCVTGVTEHAKTIEFQDMRVPLERAGGKLLDLVANK